MYFNRPLSPLRFHYTSGIRSILTPHWDKEASKAICPEFLPISLIKPIPYSAECASFYPELIALIASSIAV